MNIGSLVPLSIFLNLRNLLLHLRVFLIFQLVLVCKWNLHAKLYRTLIKEISRKAPVTLKPSSTYLYMWCVIDKSWLTQEFASLNPDWFSVIRLFSVRYFKDYWTLLWRKELKSSDFSWKLAVNLLSWNRCGGHRIFLSLRHLF